MDWQDQLISLYLFICKHYQNDLSYYCERMTNFADLTFSDEEVLTLFLFGIIKKQSNIKGIYHYVNDHLSSWFPNLPSYVAFVQRLNRVAGLFAPLIERVLSTYPEKIAFSTTAY